MAWFFEDVPVGAVEETDTPIADRTDMITYAEVNDPFPIHLDSVAAEAAGFDDVIASFGYTGLPHGGLGVSGRRLGWRWAAAC